MKSAKQNYTEKQTKQEFLRGKKHGFFIRRSKTFTSIKNAYSFLLMIFVFFFDLYGICGCLCLMTSLRFAFD